MKEENGSGIESKSARSTNTSLISANISDSEFILCLRTKNVFIFYLTSLLTMGIIFFTCTVVKYNFMKPNAVTWVCS